MMVLLCELVDFLQLLVLVCLGNWDVSEHCELILRANFLLFWKTSANAVVATAATDPLGKYFSIGGGGGGNTSRWGKLAANLGLHLTEWRIDSSQAVKQTQLEIKFILL